MMPGLASRLAAGLVLGWLGIFQAVRGAEAPPAASQSEGEALARDIRSAKPEERVDVRGTIRVRRPDGKRLAAPFQYRCEVQGGLWEAVYETPGGTGIPGQRLSVTFSESRPPVYLLEERGAAGSASGGVRQLVGDAAMVPFAGSDFWLVDLGMQYLHWPSHRIVQEAKIRMRKGRPCRVLESRNTEVDARGYVRVVSWIDRETGKPILAEAFGPDGKLVKEFEIGGVTKVDGVWQLKNLEMRDVVRDSVTVLEFQYQQKE